MSSSEPKKSAIDLINEAIADLESKLGLLSSEGSSYNQQESDNAPQVSHERPISRQSDVATPKKTDLQQEELAAICKLEIKVGKIIKVWVHPEADKLYCEEIDVGEESSRSIASGLRAHYTEEQMLGKHLLVVTNLKPRKLAGFVSNGMVLCAADDERAAVEFIEPPEGAKIGEIVHFEGLPKPEPTTASQVEKKKIFQQCAVDMRTTEDFVATWNGHAFLTSAGYCKSTTIRSGAIR